MQGAWCPGHDISQLFQPLPLKLIHQRGGLVPLRVPRRQRGQGKQGRAVGRVLMAPPQETADPKPEEREGFCSSGLADGVSG